MQPHNNKEGNYDHYCIFIQSVLKTESNVWTKSVSPFGMLLFCSGYDGPGLSAAINHAFSEAEN